MIPLNLVDRETLCKQKSFVPKRNIKCTKSISMVLSYFFNPQMPYCLATLLVHIYGTGLNNYSFLNFMNHNKNNTRFKTEKPLLNDGFQSIELTVKSRGLTRATN